MKCIVLFSFLLLYSCSNKSHSIQNDASTMYLKGIVKSVEQRVYNVVINNGKITSGDAVDLDLFESTFLIEFDKKGNFLNAFYLNENGEKRRIYTGVNTFSYCNVYDFYYNNLKKIYVKRNNNQDDRYSKKYDSNNNLIEYNLKNEDGSFRGKILDKYDEEGNIIEEKSYLDNGKFEAIINCEYDENHYIVKYREADNKLKITSQYTYKYEYDNNQNWIKKIEYENLKPIKIVERKVSYFN